MLMNLHKNTWSDGLVLAKFEDHAVANDKTVKVRKGERVSGDRLV